MLEASCARVLFHHCVSSGGEEENEDTEKEEEKGGRGCGGGGGGRREGGRWGILGITRHGGLRLLKIRELYRLPPSHGIFPVELYNSG